MIIGYSRVHYGKDYLSWAIRSALPYVDKFVVLYTHVPTFGHFTTLPNPDNRDELYEIARQAAGDKLDWREGLPMTGKIIFELYPACTLLLELDADEVIAPEFAAQIVQDHHDGKLTAPLYRLPMLHLWRSFNYGCIHVDPQSGQEEPLGWPIRLSTTANPTSAPVPYPDACERLYHFGYCRKQIDMDYKWGTSIHQTEIRKEWWSEIWAKFPERLRDLHPVGVNVWNAEPIDRYSLPAILQDHPYFNMEKVE